LAGAALPKSSTIVAVTVPVLGMDVVRRIEAAPVREGTQSLSPPIAILSARVL
jgi:hypothetical protein